ncbi:trans-aconitate 2-methyltransferase [Streptomyces telluris]|uniref:Trans-aconitate 2-methyltransferase n=1 Tax=Streptomyces telluris TaxID=2720021 RepID=A0A9X2LKY1_9ACTN|nr:trans-aconitate 2-methyltransferase [Streptomyces telluris]MCQ8772841.1 trans-aconitate 2-methyltransferase [Streptomyces telluris]NJP79164.1 trans-aconitate 2-methyltransferase [Streptomyces telluris]
MTTTTATPVWDPEQYLRHSGPRSRPFHDLLARVPLRDPARIVDLGCGPGNVTALLAERWPGARITGLDNSEAMLRQARAGVPGVAFAHADLREWAPEETYDLIVSSATFQWVRGHAELFPRWVEGLAPGGVFAFTVPGNFDAPSHVLLHGLCESAAWRSRLGGLQRPGYVLTPAEYLERLAGPGLAVDAWETTYVHALPGEDAVLDWTKGTTLRPVLTALADDPEATTRFLSEYAALLREAYPRGPHGTLFPFRRVFAVARHA